MIRLLFLKIILVQCLLACSQNADINLLKTFNAREMPAWDGAMRGVSFSVYPVMPLTVGGVWLNGYSNKNDAMMRNAYKGALVIGLASGISTGLKYAVQRHR